MNIDAFALNVMSTDLWSTNAIQYLFDAAAATDFQLFFSFDMTWFTAPSQFIPLLSEYCNNVTYYHYSELPFVSTFYGGTLTFGANSPNAGWQKYYKDALSAEGIETYFVPSFSDNLNGATKFFTNFPVVDGVMSWDSAWPWTGETDTNVTTSVDQQYLSGAQAAGKTFMMAISPLQFKHLSPDQNWYRSGGMNLALRMQQVLSMQPDFLEILTWNDGGESHYLGQYWPQTIMATANYSIYTDEYDHSGWQNLVAPMISALKSGATNASALAPPVNVSLTGAFWYRPMLANTTCSEDLLGRPAGSEVAVDDMSVAIIVGRDLVGSSVHLKSGGTEIGRFTTVLGLNAWNVEGLQTGVQSVEVVSPNGTTVASGTGSIDVAGTSDTYNFNVLVVGLSATVS